MISQSRTVLCITIILHIFCVILFLHGFLWHSTKMTVFEGPLKVPETELNASSFPTSAKATNKYLNTNTSVCLIQNTAKVLDDLRKR
jgi:hypothetical protein